MFPITAELAIRVARALGPRALLLGPRLEARKAVELAVPPESIYLSELQVGSDARGRGVGGELLDWVEREAEVDGQKKRASGTRPPPSYGR